MDFILLPRAQTYSYEIIIGESRFNQSKSNYQFVHYNLYTWIFDTVHHLFDMHGNQNKIIMGKLERKEES